MLTLSREIDGKMMETFCQTMVQGMLCGLPQITTNLEIFTEKLDEGGGIVTHGVEDIANAMSSLSSNIQTISGQGKIAAKVAKERYIWDSDYFAEKYL